MATKRVSALFLAAALAVIAAFRVSVQNLANLPTTNAQKVIDPVRKKVETRATPTTKRRITTSVPARITLAYERFLELPVAVVLLVMWVVGVALLGACALLAYAAISALVEMVAEAF